MLCPKWIKSGHGDKSEQCPLAKGTATEHFREFCPNAVSLDELFDQKGQLSSN
jgi:hypothetical protein